MSADDCKKTGERLSSNQQGGEDRTKLIQTGSETQQRATEPEQAVADRRKIEITNPEGFFDAVCVALPDSYQKRLFSEELQNRKHQFDRLFALNEKLSKLANQPKKASLYRKKQQVFNQWLKMMQILLDQSLSVELRLCLLRSIQVAPKNALEIACKNYKTNWIWINWFRLLLLRIKRLFVGVSDLVAPQADAVTIANATWASAYNVLGHLGYLIYLVRLFSYTLPCLISATKKEGWAGFKRVWLRESESITNDLVWAAVGLLTVFAAVVLGMIACEAITIALYLFDVINILVHAIQREQRLRRQFQEKMGQAIMSYWSLHSARETAWSTTLDSTADSYERKITELCVRFRSNESYQNQIKAAPEELQHFVRKKLMHEMLKSIKSDVLCSNFADDLPLIDHLSDLVRMDSELVDSFDKAVTNFIEANVLLGGMLLGGVGTLAFALCSGIGLVGTQSVAVTIAAMCAAGATILSLPPVMILSLALIAAGAAVVIAMCVVRLAKKAIADNKDKKIREKDPTKPSDRISILSGGHLPRSQSPASGVVAAATVP